MRTKEIVDQINQTLRLTLNQQKFQQGIFHGLAKLVVQKQSVVNDEDRYAAMIYDNEGKEIRCEVDDTFPFKIYHRCLSVNQVSNNSIPQFGDGNNSFKETANMVAIIYGKKSVLGLTQEDLGSIISASFPSQLSITGISMTSINPGTINNDSFSVFTQEYKSTDYPLNPEDYYLSFSYQIETTFDKSCVDACLIPANTQVVLLPQACVCASDQIQWINDGDGLKTTAGQDTYSIPELLNKKVVIVTLTNMLLVNEPTRVPPFIQWSLTGINFKIEDTSFAIEEGQLLNIGYL